MKTEIAQFKRSLGHRRKKARGSKSGSYSLPIRLASLVPYRVGIWIIRQMSRSWILQRTLFRRDVQQLEAILALAAQPFNQSRVVQRHFMAKGFKWINRRRKSALGSGQEQLLRYLFPITGLDQFDRAQSTGRGVVLLNSHFGGARFVPQVLARMGIELLSLNVFKKPRAKLPDNLEVIRLHDSFLPRAVFQAQKALKKGKVVHLAGDGYSGESGVVLTFHGRQRRFAAGFAELAVSTGAVVLPVFAPIDEEGRVNIEFLDPLEGGSESVERSERVESLIRQYGRLLEQRWSQDPGNVHQRHVEKFLRLPMNQACESAVITESSTHAL